MATRQAPTTMRSRPVATRPSYMLFSIFFITLTIVIAPTLADGSSPPSTLVVYVHEDTVPPDATGVIVASPSGNLATLEFGTIAVIAFVLRETAAADSLVLGVVEGPGFREKDLSVFAVNTYVLNTTSYAGTISIQGVADQQGVGEIAITGGTGDFRFARGYADTTLVSSADPRDIVVKVVFSIKYS